MVWACWLKQRTPYLLCSCKVELTMSGAQQTLNQVAMSLAFADVPLLACLPAHLPGMPFCPVLSCPAPAFALISDYVSNSDPGIRAGAILGLGLAYAGTQREEVQELLVPLVGPHQLHNAVLGFQPASVSPVCVMPGLSSTSRQA